MGKKQKLLAQEQADQMPLTRAQVMMRDDILRSKDPEGRPNFIDPQVPLFDDELDDETPADQWTIGQTRNSGPVAVGQVLDALIGPSKDQGSRDRLISRLAEEIIFSSPETLTLGLKQWTVVQAMIEQGIRTGSDAEQRGDL